MIRSVLALVLLAGQSGFGHAQNAAESAALPQLSLEQRMLVRCSAAFAIVANRQESGEAAYARYPVMAERGREFFVRASAKVMDEAGISRESVAAALAAEAQDLVDRDTLAEVMPVCLGLLPDEL